MSDCVGTLSCPIGFVLLFSVVSVTVNVPVLMPSLMLAIFLQTQLSSLQIQI